MNEQESIGAIVEAIGEIVAYARQKALYEADCRVREELEHMRKAAFACQVERCRVATIDLARSKRKLVLLSKEVSRIPSALKVLIEPLVAELEARVEILRQLHRPRA